MGRLIQESIDLTNFPKMDVFPDTSLRMYQEIHPFFVHCLQLVCIGLYVPSNLKIFLDPQYFHVFLGRKISRSSGMHIPIHYNTSFLLAVYESKKVIWQKNSQKSLEAGFVSPAKKICLTGKKRFVSAAKQICLTGKKD